MRCLERPFVYLLTGALFALTLLQGCSPTAASLDEDDPAVGVTASNPNPAAAQVQEPVDPPPAPDPRGVGQAPEVAGGDADSRRFGLPANPKLMPKMDRAEIEGILSQMEPEEHSKVLLRFNSFSLLLFYAIYHRYPTLEEGLDILLDPPEPPDGRKREPFAQEILLVDGWGHPIGYEPAQLENGNPYFSLKSFGPDGIPSEDDLEVEPDVENVCREVSARIAAGELEQNAPPQSAPAGNE